MLMQNKDLCVFVKKLLKNKGVNRSFRDLCNRQCTENCTKNARIGHRSRACRRGYTGTWHSGVHPMAANSRTPRRRQFDVPLGSHWSLDFRRPATYSWRAKFERIPFRPTTSFAYPEATMSLQKIASVPPATVTPGTTVLEAVELMAEHAVGAVAVVEHGNLLGIFTERDLMLRVVLRQRLARNTRVGDVMTSPVETVAEESPEDAALVHMVERHVRHLPIVNAGGTLTGMLSIRNLLEHRVDELTREVHALDQYLSNDGPGG